MKKQVVLLLGLICLTHNVSAAGSVQLQTANTDIHDQSSLQNGAKLFMNYCAACHSLSLMRYKRVAKDLAIDEQMMRNNLIFNGAQIGDTMDAAINPAQAEKWFGIVPPDLSLTARSKGLDWIYSYLNGFYEDSSRPFGVNNTVLANASMPDVLWQLKQNLSAQEFEMQINDIVNFLDYVGEPIKLERAKIGIKVIFFLIVLLVLSFLLKKEYWKDVKYGKWRRQD